MVGSPFKTFEESATDDPVHIVTPPPTMVTVGVAFVIPVKDDIWPTVIVAPVAVSVFAANGENFSQGLVT